MIRSSKADEGYFKEDALTMTTIAKDDARKECLKQAKLNIIKKFKAKLSGDEEDILGLKRKSNHIEDDYKIP